MKSHYILSIKAAERLGLLHLITGVIEKKSVGILSLSAACTDIHGIMLITVEVNAQDNILPQLAFKLKNIIEVFSVEIAQYNGSVCLRTAYFKVKKTFLESPKSSVLFKHNATIITFYPEAFLLAKCGTDAIILSLYNDLDGEHLIGFSQTGLITDSKLIGEDESLVLSRLAA